MIIYIDLFQSSQYFQLTIFIEQWFTITYICYIAGYLTSGGVEGLGFFHASWQDKIREGAGFGLMMFVIMFGSDPSKFKSHMKKMNVDEDVSTMILESSCNVLNLIYVL